MKTFSDEAKDLLIIAIKIAGFSKEEIQRKIIRHPVDRKINVHTVERWLTEIEKTYE